MADFGWSNNAAGITLASTTPLPEAVGGTPGSDSTAARGSHQHPRLTSVTAHTSDTNGEFIVMFTRQFSTMPGITCSYTESADNQPIVYKTKSWLGPAGAAYVSGDYYGCVIKSYRSQAIPTNLVTLLLGGVFNLFSASAASVAWTCIAVMRSS